MSQTTLRPSYRIPNQIKLSLPGFLKALVWLWFCALYPLFRREGSSSVHWAVSSCHCIWLLHIIRVTHQTAALEIKRLHNLSFRHACFEIVILQTLIVYAKSNNLIFLCFLHSLGGGDVGSLLFYCLPCLTVEAQTSSCIALRFMWASSRLSI